MLLTVILNEALSNTGGIMVTIIVQLMKVLMIILLSLYALEGFSSLAVKASQARVGILKRQRIFFYMLHFCANATLFVVTKELKFVVFYVLQLFVFSLFMIMYDIFYPKASQLVVNNLCALSMIGFFMLERLNFGLAIRQFAFFAAAIVICSLIPLMIRRFQWLDKLAWVYAGVGIALLVVVLAIASLSYGAKLSLTIGPVSIQPSEFVKITFVFFIAAMLYRDTSFKTVVITTVFAAIHVLILIASKDLGTALIFFVAYMMMIFVATKDIRYLLLIIAGGVAGSVAAYHLFSHLQVRVLAWKDPFSVIDGAGYQVAQSLFAIGTGGWFGLGLFQGLPNSIPVVERDFMFSAISEEMGLLFAIGVLMICICCFLMFLNIAMQVKNQFYKLIALGLGVVYGFQIFLTVGGATKFIPSTGVTLPLVSYGGSSLVSTLMIFSIIQGMYILREEEGDRSGETKKSKANKKRKAEKA